MFIPELSVIASPVTPQLGTVRMWKTTTEGDRSQQCPETHPFAYDNVNTFKISEMYLNICLKGNKCCATWQEWDVSEGSFVEFHGSDYEFVSFGL